jgi:mRNA interferase HigB
MRVVTPSVLKRFWLVEPFSKRPLAAWLAEVQIATWSDPGDVKAQYSSASILQDGRVVFNIGGNKFRLVVHIAYKLQRIYIKFIGTHQQYDKIDAQTIHLERRD